MDVLFMAVARTMWNDPDTDFLAGAFAIFTEEKDALHRNFAPGSWMISPATMQNLSDTYQKRQIINSQPMWRRVSGQHLPQVPSLATSARAQFKHDPLIPRAGDQGPSQPASDTSRTSALHQAHLRNPTFDVVSPSAKAEVLYQSVIDYAILPQRLSGDQCIQVYNFVLPEDTLIAQTIDPGDGQRKIRRIPKDSLQYRFRMVHVEAPEPTSTPDVKLEEGWAVKPISWLKHMYYTMNGEQLEARTKQHYAKDLPIDVTEFVRAGQENKLQIIANFGDEEAAALLPHYAFAVEVIGMHTHEAILELCQSKVTPSNECLRSIVDGLRPDRDAEDDEVVIDDAKRNINIYDPISLDKICEIPVRGQDCKHAECFDLAIFLASRTPEKSYLPCDVDVWKCPICAADVRPHRMFVDGFLKDVHDRLMREGKAETRVITVTADGTWVPKKIKEDLGSRQPTPTHGMVLNGAAARPRMMVAGGYVAPSRQKSDGVIDLTDD